MMILTKSHHRPTGFIAIVSLLIIFTISMLIALSMLKDGIDNASLSLYSINYENAKINADICLEDTLLRLRRESQFTRDLNYALSSDESCQTQLLWSAPAQLKPGVTQAAVELSVTGQSQGFYRSFEHELTIQQYEVNQLDGTVDYTNNIQIISSEEITPSV